jgi:hypothetical protein
MAGARGVRGRGASVRARGHRPCLGRRGRSRRRKSVVRVAIAYSHFCRPSAHVPARSTSPPGVCVAAGTAVPTPLPRARTSSDGKALRDLARVVSGSDGGDWAKPPSCGGSPREGACSELASGAATGGGGPQAPPTRTRCITRTSISDSRLPGRVVRDRHRKDQRHDGERGATL